jgi:thioredoxin 1
MMNWTSHIKEFRRRAPALLALLVFTAVAAEPAAVPPVVHSSYPAASAAAAADQSLVLLIFSAEWCGPCQQLKKRTLSAPEFLRQENPLHLADVDIDANQKMARDFAVDAVPTLVLLTADGKIIARRTGFLEAADLLAWLQAGRGRAAAGQWEGTAPGAQFAGLIQRAAADNLGTNDLQRLVDLLGDADPANREQAGKILLARRESAVPPLIAAVGNPYLGVRIAAGELLQRMAPNLPVVDPWSSPAESSNAVVALKKWWAATGQLPVTEPNPTHLWTADSLKEALGQLRGDDPVRRTAAMTRLVSRGTDVLPAVREAIQRAERSGDARTLGLLEDVRWTLLVPDALEQHGGGIRTVLARGKSSERQAAVGRLARMGRDASEVLIDLAGDADPLVVESAVRALSDVGGSDAVTALAALLKSADNNLRMTAAQALGHTKNAAAVKPLLAVTGDPDEVVACTALSALEETQTHGSYRSPSEKTPEEIIGGLKRCLTDPRWRVRAAAAEITGKLSIRGLADDLKKRLDDPDGFVVKNALTALGQLGAAPEPAQLIALSQRLPSLQSDAVALLLQSDSDETVKTVTELFNSGSEESRRVILDELAKKETSDETKTDGEWKPLLKQAIAAADPRLRHGAAEVLGQRSPKLAVELLGLLLADGDRETRWAAANAVLRILDRDEVQLGARRFSSSSPAKTNQPFASAGQIAAWHTALLQHPEPAPGLCLAAAIFVTGDGHADLPMLAAALNPTNRVAGPGRAQQQLDAMAIELVMPKLSLAEGRTVLEKLCAFPIWFAQAASLGGRCKPEVADYLWDPARFRSVVESGNNAELPEALELLAGYDYNEENRRMWSLWTENDRTKAVALALLESTNAAWRSAAVFSLGLRADATNHPVVFEKAIADPSPWVRASAVKAVARNIQDRPARERHLSAALSDTNLAVATTAAVALLEPEIRAAAGLENELDYFEFETVRGGRIRSYHQSDERPLAILESKPAFLPAVREHLRATNAAESVAFMLLLAQHGEFDGVDRLVDRLAALNSDTDSGAADALLTGIALSHDMKYLPALRQMAAIRRDESDLRKVLSALKGMSGPDARQLRLVINKKIRSAGGSSINSD